MRKAELGVAAFSCMMALILLGCSAGFQEIVVSSTPAGAKVYLDHEDSGECITTPGSFRLRRNRNHPLVAVYGTETQKTAVLSHDLSSLLSRLGAAALADPATAQTILHPLTCPDYVLIPNMVHFDFEAKTEPNDASRLKHLGFYYFSKNDKARAKEYLNHSFQLNPKQLDVAYVLGRLGVVIKIPRKTENDLKERKQ